MLPNINGFVKQEEQRKCLFTWWRRHEIRKLRKNKTKIIENLLYGDEMAINPIYILQF